jgi:adenosylmethionine---8-amino-7-oxononanoate aminotransferase
VQGAAGMIVHPEGYLRAVRELCDEHGVLLICDEVAVGFGRTGTMFACQQEGVSPDLMCIAKGVTGGYLPLAATLTTESVYEAFLGEHHELKTFFHGHTYTGNPLACAAALATLDVIDEEGLAERAHRLGERLRDGLRERVGAHESVREVRGRGLMVALELESGALAKRVLAESMERNLLLLSCGTYGQVVRIIPPLVPTEEEVDLAIGVIGDALAASAA